MVVVGMREWSSSIGECKVCVFGVAACACALFVRVNRFASLLLRSYRYRDEFYIYLLHVT